MRGRASAAGHAGVEFSMAKSLLLAMAQLNPTVGDLSGNVRILLAARDEAARQGADLVICPELYVSGYPPEDLVMRTAFQAEAREQVAILAAATAGGGPETPAHWNSARDGVGRDRIAQRTETSAPLRVSMGSPGEPPGWLPTTLPSAI